MADFEKVRMLIGQCRMVLQDHPYKEEDPRSYIVTLSLFHDELKLIIKALEDLDIKMTFDEIKTI